MEIYMNYNYNDINVEKKHKHWVSVDFPDELNLLEESIYDCQNVIQDIQRTEKYSDNLNQALDAIKILYDLKFKELAARYEDVERKHMNLLETWMEMKPTHPDVMTEDLEDEDQLEMFKGESGC